MTPKLQTAHLEQRLPIKVDWPVASGPLSARWSISAKSRAIHAKTEQPLIHTSRVLVWGAMDMQKGVVVALSVKHKLERLGIIRILRDSERE